MADRLLTHSLATAAMQSNALSTILCALCLSSGSLPAAVPVAWWSFDDPAALGRDSAGTNDATVYGAAVPCSGVRDGGILIQYRPNGFLRADTSPSLEITGPMTILVWARANAVDANYPLVYKAGGWDNGQMAYMMDLDWNSGGYYPRFAVSSDGYASGYQEVISPEPLSAGEWHLVAGVYDGTNIMVYVDGRLEASQAHSAGIYAGKDPLCIGWDWNFCWNGVLDELRIFDVALSGTDILAEFEGRTPLVNAQYSGSFGRLPVGQARTNEFILTVSGTSEVSVAALEVGGADAGGFQVLSPSGGFVLSPGLTNAVTVQVRFAPEVAQFYNAELTINSSANNVMIPLTGHGINDKSLTLDLQRRNEAGEVVVTRQSFQGSQLAVLVVDAWDSHPDPEMASRTAALVPRLNQALEAARDLGITVIFCPSECLADFEGTPYRANIMNLPYHYPADNGFNPPEPPYADSGPGDMVPLDKGLPLSPSYAHQHPDLVLTPADLVSLDSTEIHSYCAENGITTLLYTGAAANMCVVSWRNFSMIHMKRSCDLETIMVRDLTDSMTFNGRSPADDLVVDLTMTPDRGHREVTAHNETYICSTISGAQLMQQWAPSAYTCLVSGQSNLLCYWRLDSKSVYKDCLDIQRTQTCWWYDQTNGLGFEVAGAIAADPDTAIEFKGSTTVLISPSYRDDIPTNSPLVSLSATNFTLETWVQVGARNADQWFFSHDNGLSSGVDVLLGLNQRNHFEFIVGSNDQHSGHGDVLESATAVTEADVTSSRWFHIVAVHDRDHGTVALYVNGKLDRQGVHVCRSVSLASAPHLGSRGVVAVDSGGKLSNPGFEFFEGTLDEVAIYTAPLPSDLVRLHYQTAQGALAQPVTLSATRQGDQILLSWPANSQGLRLQASDNLLTPDWKSLTVPVGKSSETNVVLLPATNGSRFFRLASQ
jgi:nicotinamidase-related amidase